MLTTVIKTVRGREHWLHDCLRSIPDQRPVLVVRCDGYEPGGLLWVLDNTRLDRWLYLQDSVQVTQDLYDMLDNVDTPAALNDCPRPFGSFLGIYHRDSLDECRPRWAANKEDAIREEARHGAAYAQLTNAPVLFTDLRDCDGQVHEVHAERRLRIGNEYLTKWKGTWR